MPGLLWARMCLPFALDHVNVWLLKDARETPQGRIDGWTIVDCGNGDDATRAAWSRIFSSCLNNLPVLRIMTTHCHPDHIGLADWLCAQWQAPLWATTAAYGFARMMSAALPGADGTAAVPFFMQHGVRKPALIAQLQQRKIIILRSCPPCRLPAIAAGRSACPHQRA